MYCRRVTKPLDWILRVKWKHVWPMLVLLCAAAGLRFYQLGYEDFWVDEIITFQRTQRPWLILFYDPMMGDNITHYLWDSVFMKLWSQFFGASEVGLRSLPALIGICAVYLIYQVSRLFNDRKTSYLVALMATLSPLLIYYSQEARAYSFQVVLVLSMVLMLEKACRTGKTHYWGWYVAVAVIGIYLQLFTTLAWVMLSIYFLYRVWMTKNIGTLKPWIISQGVIILLALPFGLYAMVPDTRETLNWIPKPQFKEIFRPLNYYVFGMSYRVLPHWLKESGKYLVFIMMILALIPQKWGLKSWLKERTDQSGLVLMGLMGFGTWILFFLVSQVKPIFVPERYLIICLPFLMILIAVAINRLSSKYLQGLALIVVLGCSLVGVVDNYTRNQKMPWRELVYPVHNQRRAEDIVWYYPESMDSQIKFYLDDRPTPISIKYVPFYDPNPSTTIWVYTDTWETFPAYYKVFLETHYRKNTVLIKKQPQYMELLRFDPLQPLS